jgi:hypothetical protein
MIQMGVAEVPGVGHARTAVVECLRCGCVREAPGVGCPRCEYVGWALSSELDERARRLLRERPPERRRLRLVV